MTHQTILTGTAIVALFTASTLAAQEKAPESILPQPKAAQAQDTAPATPPRKGQSVAEAFGDIEMQSGEVVQEVPSLTGE